MDSDADAQAPECDPVTDSLHCMTTGVFVDSVGGQDTNDGTQSSPVKTVAKALALAKSQSKPSVFLCKGSYGAVTLNTASTAATSLYGGFDCSTWAYDQSNKTLIASLDSTPALRITGFADSIVISDLSFESKDANNPGDSSIAIFIANSQDVTLRRVTATAGAGAAGTNPGAPPTNLVTKSAAAAVDATGAGPTECDCTNGSKSIGGVGGNGGNNPMSGQPGSSNPSVGESGWGTGGAAYKAGPPPTTCGPGNTGANASLGGSGGAGAASWGTLDADGWHPADGNPGTAGNPGQGGGGGGGGQSTTGGGGGSGACGGCGGAGGFGGGGGGASIAVASYMSTVTITGGSFTSSAGGVGGKGGDGEVGGSGPAGGDVVAGDDGAGCKGGSGGNGAGGGGGGGGAGGLSVSILWLGGTMTRDPSTLVMMGAGGTQGMLGNPGGGGKNSSGQGPSGIANASDGCVGISQTMLDLTPDGGS